MCNIRWRKRRSRCKRRPSRSRHHYRGWWKGDGLQINWFKSCSRPLSFAVLHITKIPKGEIIKMRHKAWHCTFEYGGGVWGFMDSLMVSAVIWGKTGGRTDGTTIGEKAEFLLPIHPEGWRLMEKAEGFECSLMLSSLTVFFGFELSPATDCGLTFVTATWVAREEGAGSAVTTILDRISLHFASLWYKTKHFLQARNGSLG